MRGIVERLNLEYDARLACGQDWSDLLLAAAGDIERLRARVAELEAEAFKFAANQCHHGYGAENGEHRCQYQDRIAKLEEALELLVDHQNGCPLPKYEEEWTRAMALARAALPEIAPPKVAT